MTDENENNETTSADSAMTEDSAAAVLSELGGGEEGQGAITDNPDLFYH